MKHQTTEDNHALSWWKELLYIAGFYFVYSQIRNQFGSNGLFAATSSTAANNAELVIKFERALGLYFEETVQTTFLNFTWFMWASNVFYGSLHFIVTIGAGIYLYWKFPFRFRRYRSTLGATTAIALTGFALFPLMPPRLLSAEAPYGANLIGYKFVDSLSEFGGLWSFDSGTMQAISNQWAAMPSLHLAWAAWCVYALYPILRRKVSRSILLTYPLLTLFTIVVTGNHYWIDGIAGLLTLALGATIGNRLNGYWGRRRLISSLKL